MASLIFIRMLKSNSMLWLLNFLDSSSLVRSIESNSVFICMLVLQVRNECRYIKRINVMNEGIINQKIENHLIEITFSLVKELANRSHYIPILKLSKN